MREDAVQHLARKTANEHADHVPGLIVTHQPAKVRNPCEEKILEEKNAEIQKAIHVITTLSLANLTYFVNPSFVYHLICKANFCR